MEKKIRSAYNCLLDKVACHVLALHNMKPGDGCLVASLVEAADPEGRIVFRFWLRCPDGIMDEEEWERRMVSELEMAFDIYADDVAVLSDERIEDDGYNDIFEQEFVSCNEVLIGIR